MRSILDDMLSVYGLEEIPGAEHNGAIIDMLKSVDEKIEADEVSWCSAALNYFAKKNGFERSGLLTARSWGNVGEETKPFLGCVVVLWRDKPKSWKGHVGLYINHDDKYVYVLGGNQDNSICIKRYNINRVLSYRKLKRI